MAYRLLRPRRHRRLEDLHGLVVERPEARREGAAAGPAVAFGHSYNAANQRIGETVSDNTWLSYPSGAGTTAYTANSLNQYTAVGAVTPTYDGNGNLTFDGTTTLGHDPENRLVSASGGGNTATYAFDPRGRRKVRTVNGTTTVTVTGADNRELMDYDGATGAILRWYAYGPGPNAVLNQMNVASGTRDTLLPDLLGSIVASVDSSTGNIAPFGYRPYGTTAAAPAQFGYTGQRVDQETGLYYYRARHYSPQWGRFAQADPIGYQGGINLYGYVFNDPLNMTDSGGMAPESSMNYSYAWDSGPSWGQGLLQSSINAVPGAYYSGLAQQEYRAGNYASAAVYGGASLADATLGILTFGLSTRASAAIRSTTSAVSLYEVGPANALRARSIVGDRLEVHHVMQAHPAQQIIANYDRITAPAIAISRRDHQMIPNLSGQFSGSARDVLARDIRNLRTFTSAPNTALQELIQLNKTQYPGAFGR